MSKALPFTKASIKRAVAAAREAGLSIKAIGPDGTVIVDNGPDSASIVPIDGDNDPYVAAVERSCDAKASRKRNAHS